MREALVRHTELSQKQGRMVTGFIMALAALNALLIFSISAVALWLWSGGAISIGIVATAITFALQLGGHGGLARLGAHGSLREHRRHAGVAGRHRPAHRHRRDRPDARELAVAQGEIRFEHASFGYGTRHGRD